MAYQSIYDGPEATGDDFMRRKVLVDHWRSRAVGLMAAACTASGMAGRSGVDPITQLAMQKSGKRTVLNKDQVRAAGWIRALASAASHVGANVSPLIGERVDTSCRPDRDWIIVSSMDAHAEAGAMLGEIAELVGEEAFIILIRVAVHFQTVGSAAIILEDDPDAIKRGTARAATKQLCGRTLRSTLRRIAEKMPSDVELNDDHKKG